MARLSVALLGSPQVTRGGELVRDFGYDKVRALLAYLAVEAERPHRREALAALLWPDTSDARHGLRQALALLRRAIGDETAVPPYLLVTHDSIGFGPAADVWVDVAAFEARLDECERHPHRNLETCSECAQRLDGAVALYRGDFLAGFAPSVGVAFEDWAVVHRERLRRRVLHALTHLTAYHERRGDSKRARDALERQLALEPWRESAHRGLMRLLWQNGERTAALAQYERCRRMLAEELAVEPEAETTALWEKIRFSRPDGAVAGDEPNRLQRPARNVPEQPTPLIGRERELEAIAGLLANPECRLLTLIGPGGIGKTRLAMQAAVEQAPFFSQGAAFVPLATVQAGAFVLPAIAEAVGLTLRARSDPKPHVLAWLRERELLLVLDNVEHLLGESRLIAEILALAPKVTILATSRERLSLRGEWVLPVDGLAVPTGDGADGYEEYGAIQLCLQGLQRARPLEQRGADDRQGVVEICRAVEGMPLAIELATAWGVMLSTAEIAQEIRRGLGFLAAEWSDEPARHHSMRAVFDHSWNLLTEEEQRVFQLLAVFRGGFPRPAAVELADASLPVLAALVRKSLLRATQSGRYEVHELLRQYGEERLAEDPAAHRRAHDRHCAYYLDFMRHRETALTGRDQQAALAEIAAEIGNIRAAWRWATAEARVSDIAGATHGLWLFYTTRGWVWEGAEVFGDVVAALAGRGEHDGIDQATRDLALGAALTRLASYRTRLGRYDEARARLEESLRLLRGLEAPRELGLALNIRAMVAHATGDYDDEQATLTESLIWFRSAEDSWGAGYTLNDLGMAAHLRGHDTEAARLSGESLEMFRRIGDRRGQGLALNNLGVVAAERGEYAEAARLHRASLALRRETEDQWGISTSLVQLGNVARLAGQFRDAESSLREALRTALEGEVMPVALEALVEFSVLRSAVGDNEVARRILTAVAGHAAGQRWLRERAERLLAGLTPSASLVVDEDRTAASSVEELAEMLLRSSS